MAETPPGAGPPPPRVRVSGPPRRHRTPLTRTGDIDAGTRLGEVYVGSLIRAQLWLAVRYLLLLAVVVGALPLTFFLLPDLAPLRLFGFPVSWLLLGVAIYPFLFLLGRGYVRRAEQNEDRFAELISHGREATDQER